MTTITSDKCPRKAEIAEDGKSLIDTRSGRPSIDNDPALQKEYTEIYLNKIIDGLTEVEIASQRQISRWKVSKALKWCRNANNAYSMAEQVIDAVNICDFRMHQLVAEQGHLRDELKKAEAGPDMDFKRTGILYRLLLLYEDNIQAILDKKFALAGLLNKQMQAQVIAQVPTLAQQMEAEVAFVNMMEPQDRESFIKLLEKY
jgi:hypothetical protein